MKKLLGLLSAAILLYSCKQSPVLSAEELRNSLQPPVAQKTIDPTADNVVEGHNGVKVFIPANSLIFDDGGKVSSSVVISIQEFFSPSDFFSRNLSTVSGSSLLQTAGMVHIKAEAEGKLLRIDPAAAAIIAFPARDELTGMETFYGDSSGGSVRWYSAAELYSESLLSEEDYASDSSLFEKRITVCGYLSMVNEKEITWKIQHPDSTIFRYISRNLSPGDSLLRGELCDNAGILQLILQIDSSGQITGTSVKSGSEILGKRLESFFTQMPLLDMSSMYTGSSDAEYTLSLCCHSQVAPEKYREKFEQKYAAFKEKATRSFDVKEAGYYFLTVKGLGWINCDRFEDSDDPKTDFIVRTGEIRGPQVMLIFEDLNSVMQGVERNGQVIFGNIPLGRKVKIVSIGQGTEFAEMAMQSTTVSKEPYVMRGYKPFTLNEFKQIVDQ